MWGIMAVVKRAMITPGERGNETTLLPREEKSHNGLGLGSHLNVMNDLNKGVTRKVRKDTLTV